MNEQKTVLRFEAYTDKENRGPVSHLHIHPGSSLPIPGCLYWLFPQGLIHLPLCVFGFLKGIHPYNYYLESRDLQISQCQGYQMNE